MLTCKEYRKVQSIKEAYELNQKKNNRVIAGGVWLKMSNRGISTLIDLSGLGLDQITENEEEFIIGCMTTLRALELHKGLNAYTKGAFRESVRHIVGVQFRNCATVGGSIFGRFGFSDVLTVLLAMDTMVELYGAGTVPLREFVDMPYDNDILVSLHVRKQPIRICYVSQRNSATDFPVVACAVSQYGGGLHISIGARPVRAELFEISDEAVKEDRSLVSAEAITNHFVFGDNRRAGAAYRRHVAGVLVKRAMQALETIEI